MEPGHVTGLRRADWVLLVRTPCESVVGLYLVSGAGILYVETAAAAD